MAKGMNRPGREKRKPKADKNKKPKGVQPTSPFAKPAMPPTAAAAAPKKM